MLIGEEKKTQYDGRRNLSSNKVYSMKIMLILRKKPSSDLLSSESTVIRGLTIVFSLSERASNGSLKTQSSFVLTRSPYIYLVSHDPSPPDSFFDLLFVCRLCRGLFDLFFVGRLYWSLFDLLFVGRLCRGLFDLFFVGRLCRGLSDLLFLGRVCRGQFDLLFVGRLYRGLFNLLFVGRLCRGLFGLLFVGHLSGDCPVSAYIVSSQTHCRHRIVRK
ncbi:hypothetical protein TNCV_4212071 [Trichonephila clavipes]|nr:hypothetical protein TNCV_4212071 [Trichonephila clavipes]